MGNQTDYFERIGYRGKYHIGDRVFGHYKKIPFVGTVGNDRLINNLIGPEITIHLDLLIKYIKRNFNVNTCKYMVAEDNKYKMCWLLFIIGFI